MFYLNYNHAYKIQVIYSDEMDLYLMNELLIMRRLYIFFNEIKIEFGV